MVQSSLICSRFVAEGKVHFKSYLAADPRAGDMTASQKGEGNGHSWIQLILATYKTL